MSVSDNYDTYLNPLLENYAVPAMEALAVMVAGVILYTLFYRATYRLGAKGLIPLQLESTLIKIAKWLLIIVVILIILGLFGVSVASLWTALSGVLVLVALGFVAVWSVLSNILCSVLLVIFAPFRIGDDIEIQDPAANITLRGRVVGMNMIFTTVESLNPDDAASLIMVRIPNNLFFQKYVRCWPGAEGRSLKNYLADEHKRVKEE